MEENLDNLNVYFAAANGYDGFRSNFETVFSASKVKKLFILKGGPGTGKSTLMRRIAEEFRTSKKVTRILCSSDRGSLDGVLIESDGICVGVADGTAPHVVEPKYPGAVEEIVNLGDGFNYDRLAMESRCIIELSKLKGMAYKSAYSALKAAGDVKKYIDMLFLDSELYKKAETISDELTKNVESGDRETPCDEYLISSFSKDGHTFLPYDYRGKEIVRVCGDGVSEYIIMKQIASRFLGRGCIIKQCFSPFSTCMHDIIECRDTVFTVADNDRITNEICISLSEIPGYVEAKKIYDSLLLLAQKEFTNASVRHFELEDIYSRNISFEANDVKERRIIEEINKVFCK
jgi:hypothetical protein